MSDQALELAERICDACVAPDGFNLVEAALLIDRYVAELKDELGCLPDTEEAVEIAEAEEDGLSGIHFAALQIRNARAERDAALKAKDSAMALWSRWDEVRNWAQDYLDVGRWAGHHVGDAIKQELIERDVERDSLRAQLAVAQADVRRLDWLDGVNAATNARNGTIYGWRFEVNCNRAALTDHNLPALSVREAIDFAITRTGEPKP